MSREWLLNLIVGAALLAGTVLIIWGFLWLATSIGLHVVLLGGVVLWGCHYFGELVRMQLPPSSRFYKRYNNIEYRKPNPRE